MKPPYKGEWVNKNGDRVRVETTLHGYPVCFMDQEWCDVKQCFYHISLWEFGNCLLRVDRVHTYREIGVVLGVTKQSIHQAIGRLMEKCTRVLTEG